MSLFRSGELEESIEVFGAAAKAYERYPQELRTTARAREDEAILWTNLGNVLLDGKKDVERAKECMERSLSLREGLLAEDPESPEWLRSVSLALGNLALCALADGNQDNALASLVRAMEMADAACERRPDDPVLQGNARFQVQHLIQLAIQRNDTIEWNRWIDHYAQPVYRGPKTTEATIDLIAYLVGWLRTISSEPEKIPAATTLEQLRAVETSLMERARILISAFANEVEARGSQNTPKKEWAALMHDQRFREAWEGTTRSKTTD